MKQNPKSRLSFIIRDPNEIYHSKGINSTALGKNYKSEDQSDI